MPGAEHGSRPPGGCATSTTTRANRTSRTPTSGFYIVRGPRGASYGLLRTGDHPELLFAVNLHGFLCRTPFGRVLFRVADDGNRVVE
jgi:hypothetical protein